MHVFWIVPALLLPMGEETVPPATGGEMTAAERGYRNLRKRTYLPPDFDQKVFDNLWRVWPKAERELAKDATVEQRHRLTVERYGLIPDADNPDNGPGIGYTPDGKSGWVMNCLACHGGQVKGRTIPGLPNSNYALQTLTEDVLKTKLLQFKKPSHLDTGIATLPLSTTNGTTNAVVFGIILNNYRDRNMDVDLARIPPTYKNHDMDAPPFWNVKYKSTLYADGFAPKNHRMLLQFIMLPSTSGKKMRSWEKDYSEILAWIESIKAPKYDGQIDQQLAEKGHAIFNDHCARCHGTYAADGTVEYEQKNIPLDEIGTDSLRHSALTAKHRTAYRDGWMTFYGRDKVIGNPVGYVAPPLKGIWASAPYFHNGSVPTLWHVLHPDKRPKVWKRTREGYDDKRMGLEVSTFDKVPKEASTGVKARSYFDTSKPGKSAGGHLFPNDLDPGEKAAVLEYLKGL